MDACGLCAKVERAVEFLLTPRRHRSHAARHARGRRAPRLKVRAAPRGTRGMPATSDARRPVSFAAPDGDGKDVDEVPRLCGPAPPVRP